MNSFKVVTKAVCLLLFCISVADSEPQDCAKREDVHLRVLTDTMSYQAGATLHLKFLITNDGEAPIYFYRTGMSACTGQMGYVSLYIDNEQGQHVNTSGCSADTWPLGKSDAVKELADADSGIRVNRHEIFGFEWDEKLSKERGTYSLKAELVPAFFSDEQRKALSERHMRVLQCRVAAPVVTTAVK